jgi:tRNA nucleotidyltransferase (CCA-adding enzyme)
LRVLRVARFAARFAHLGFRVHDDTLALMRQISGSGELDHLVAERCWSEIFRSMDTSRPSEFLNVLRASGALAVILREVDCLFGVPQDKRWHPEVDTGKHVCLAMDLAAERKYGATVVFALMLHDVGKGLTAKNELPAHHGHEKAGMGLVDAVCKRLKTPVAVHRLASQVCRGHLRCHRVLEMTPAKVMKLLEDLDAFRRKDILGFLHACEADYLGREGLQDRGYPQGLFLQKALESALSIQARDLQEGEVVQGRALGEKLRQARIEAIAALSD